MQKSYKRIALLCVLILVTPLAAQKFSIKPMVGYYYPKLGEVNSKIKTDVDELRNILGAPIPSAGKFNGNIIFGGQIEYQANEEYFFNLNVSYYQEKVALCRAIGDRRGLAESLHVLGLIAVYLGAFEEGELLARQSLTLSEGIGDPRRQSIAYDDLGFVLWQLGRFREAQAAYQKSITIGKIKKISK